MVAYVHRAHLSVIFAIILTLLTSTHWIHARRATSVSPRHCSVFRRHR